MPVYRRLRLFETDPLLASDLEKAMNETRPEKSVQKAKSTRREKYVEKANETRPAEYVKTTVKGSVKESFREKTCLCDLTRRQVLVWANVEAGFWHLGLSVLLLCVIALVGPREDRTEASGDWKLGLGVGLSVFGYVLSLLSAVSLWKGWVKRCGLLFVPCAIVFLGGLGVLAAHVQEHVTGVFPVTLSTQYNHPDPIPPPFDSRIINFSYFPANYTVSPPCKTTAYTGSEYVDWFGCLRKSDWRAVLAANPDFYREATGRLVAKGLWRPFRPLGDTTIYLWWLVEMFTLTTCGFHFFLAWSAANGPKQTRCRGCSCTAPYYHWITLGRSPLRWAEYSTTAALMIVMVLVINRVTDVYTLVFNFIIMQLLNTFGASMDYTSNPVLVAWYWFCSAAAFAWVFVLLFFSFYETISPYLTRTDTYDADELWGGLFGFIDILNWSIFLSFSSFAVCNAVHQCLRFDGCFLCGPESCLKSEVDPPRRETLMLWAEVTYIVLSIVSKGLLVTILSVGAAMRA